MHSPARDKYSQPQPGSDPILRYQECAAELNVSLDTFKRRVLPYIAVVEVSPHRRGVRRSVLESLKDARTVPPARNEDAAGR
jgi:hypothetical protein